MALRWRGADRVRRLESLLRWWLPVGCRGVRNLPVFNTVNIMSAMRKEPLTRCVKPLWRICLSRRAAAWISVRLLAWSSILLCRLCHRCFKQSFIVSSGFDELLVQLLEIICPVVSLRLQIFHVAHPSFVCISQSAQ